MVVIPKPSAFHHVFEKQANAFPELARDPRCIMVLCDPHHTDHTNAAERVPFEKLPACVFELAEETGPRAVAYLERTYPRSVAA